jgi:hypothetical protein
VTVQAVTHFGSLVSLDFMAHANHSHQSVTDSMATGPPLRSETPESDVEPPSIRSNPFTTPTESAASRTGSTTALQLPEQSRYFRSRRVKRGTVERPWMNRKDPREKWVTIIPLMGIFAGLVLSGLLIWDGLRSVVRHEYCLVLDEDFSGGLNSKVWTKEVEVGGFG